MRLADKCIGLDAILVMYITCSLDRKHLAKIQYITEISQLLRNKNENYFCFIFALREIR
jgi:hypothetical protein